MTIHYWSILGGAVAAILIAKLEHSLRRKRQRRCSCGRETFRQHQMISCERVQQMRFRQLCETYTFAVCVCGEVRLVRSDDKWFWFWEIEWRKLFDPSQFMVDPSLFERAGLTGKAMPWGVRKLFEEERRKLQSEEIVVSRSR